MNRQTNIFWSTLAITSFLLSNSVFAQQTGTENAAADSEPGQLEEIIVTATKRPESVREISASVSAYNESALEEIGAKSFADYLTRIPGVVFNESVPGNSAAIVRGISTTTGIAQAQGTTGYFINDIPLTDPFYSTGIPDIDSFDVQNITVLRGPQGTLFGSASMGGAINYQATAPELDRFAMHLRGDLEQNDADENGYGGNVMLNVPVVSGKFAIRGVFSTRKVGGFINNLGTGEQNSNETTMDGGRLLATWAPGDATSFNYMYLDQTTSTDDLGSTEPLLGKYEKNTLIPEPYEFHTELHNLRFDQQFDLGTLTATATHAEKDFESLQDFSGLIPFLAPVAFLEPGSSKGDTYELRFASASDQSFEYLVGAYYNQTDEHVINLLEAPAAAPVFGTSTLLDADVFVDGLEQALFGEGSWHFNEQWKATVGGRWFRTEIGVTTVQSGPLVGPTTTTFGESEESGFSPKVSITWQPSPEQMVYALASKGFRFGGPNFTTDPDYAIPADFNSDSLWNYELGTRLSYLENRLLVDATAYLIDWDDIQVTQSSPNGFTYTDNAGKARNMGLELSADYLVTPDFKLQAAATYLDGELKRDFVSSGGIVSAGTTLPGASDWQISDSLVYAPQSMKFSPEFVLTHRYISSAPSQLIPDSQEQGGYNLVDLRLGVQLGSVGVFFYVDNIGDTRGVSRANTGVRGPVEYLIQPRTMGITLDYRL